MYLVHTVLKVLNQAGQSAKRMCVPQSGKVILLCILSSMFGPAHADPAVPIESLFKISAGQNLILANLSPAPVSHWQSLQLESFGVLLPMSSAPCVLALDNASARACEKCVATLLSSHVRAGPCASCKAFTSLPVAFRSRFAAS